MFMLYAGKPAEMPSTYLDFNASKAVDGIYLPREGEIDWSQIAQTEFEVNPWLRTNLQQNHVVLYVRILNREG